MMRKIKLNRFYLGTLIRCALVSLLMLSLSNCVSITDAISEEPIQPDPGKRSFGEKWDDRQLKTIVKVNLNKANPLFSELNINVYSYNAVILLTGEVPTPEMRELADATARGVNRVRQVYNELQIRPKRTLKDNASDAWISTKIKSKLLAYTDIDSKRVEVYVEDHTVYLMGMLSREQTEKITNVVRKEKGVRKVVRAIEYID